MPLDTRHSIRHSRTAVCMIVKFWRGSAWNGSRSNRDSLGPLLGTPTSLIIDRSKWVRSKFYLKGFAESLAVSLWCDNSWTIAPILMKFVWISSILAKFVDFFFKNIRTWEGPFWKWLSFEIGETFWSFDSSLRQNSDLGRRLVLIKFSLSSTTWLREAIQGKT